MHRYFPHTAEDEAQMLGVVGARIDILALVADADRRTRVLTGGLPPRRRASSDRHDGVGTDGAG